MKIKIFSGTTAEILDPSDPQLTSVQDESGWRFGAKKILRSVVNFCQRINQLLLKVVAKVFPWNRRAKRRLKGGLGDDDEA